MQAKMKRAADANDGPLKKWAKVDGPNQVEFRGRRWWYGKGSLDAAEADVARLRAAGEDVILLHRNDPASEHRGRPTVRTFGHLYRADLEAIICSGEDCKLYEALPFDRPRVPAFDIDVNNAGKRFTAADGTVLLHTVVFPVVSETMGLCGVDWQYHPLRDGLSASLGRTVDKAGKDRMKFSAHVHVCTGHVLKDHDGVRRFQVLLKSVLLEYPEAMRVVSTGDTAVDDGGQIFDTGAPFARRQMFRLPGQNKTNAGEDRILRPAHGSMGLDRFLCAWGSSMDAVEHLEVPAIAPDDDAPSDAGPKRLTLAWCRQHCVEVSVPGPVRQADVGYLIESLSPIKGLPASVRYVML